VPIICNYKKPRKKLLSIPYYYYYYYYYYFFFFFFCYFSQTKKFHPFVCLDLFLSSAVEGKNKRFISAPLLS
jgi:hypothetical protein